MRLARYRKTHRPRIEIIPMIDTVFFLLVFFMVATLSMTHMRGMKVNLPAATTARKDVAAHRTITIKKDGSLYLDEVAVDEAELKGLLERMKDRVELVVINADRGVAHGRVVEVMDRVRLSGIKRLAIATEPEDRR